MGSIGKVTNQMDFYRNQFRILQLLSMMDGKMEKTYKLPEREACRINAIQSLLLAGFPHRENEQEIIFLGESLGLPDCVIPKSFLGHEAQALFALKAEGQDTSQAPLAEEKTSGTEPLIAEEGYTGAYKAGDEKKTENLIYGRFKREDSTYPHAESENQKYMDTMWFQTFHISCDTEEGYMPEDFDLIVYPLALERDRMPVPVAACLIHRGVYKAGFSEKGKYSITLNFEDYVFSLTLRFVDGEMKTKISLSSLSDEKYKITSIENKNYQSKDMVPESFGKQIWLNKDILEIYPLETINESMTGCVAFMYRMISEDGKVECGLSEERSLTIGFGDKVIRCFCYWEGHDKERKLIVGLD